MAKWEENLKDFAALATSDQLDLMELELQHIRENLNPTTQGRIKYVFAMHRAIIMTLDMRMEAIEAGTPMKRRPSHWEDNWTGFDDDEPGSGPDPLDMPPDEIEDAPPRPRPKRQRR